MMDLERQLRAALVPCAPGSQLRAAVNTRLSAARSGRRPVRPWMFGVLMAAAAAAMFTVYEQGPMPLAEMVAAPAVKMPEISAAEAPVAEAEPTSAPANVPSPVRVVLLLDDLQIRGENAEAVGQLREFYDTMEKELRSISGLTVLRPGQEGLHDIHVDFHLSVVGHAKQGSWSVNALLPKALKGMATGADLPSVCASAARRPESMCVSAAKLARGLVFGLHLDLLPDDGSFRQGLRATLLDARENYVNRFNALEQLSRKAAGDTDAAVIRAALDLIAANPRGTERMLDLLRGHTDPALLSALIDMAYQHPVASVRSKALSMLIDDYKSDPSAKSAIESLAGGDRMPLQTRVAERAISGDGQWYAYVLATVKDPNLTPSQRFAPLAYLMQNMQKDDVRTLLDDDFVTALKDVLPGVVGGKDESEALSAFGVMGLIPDANTPAAIDLMLAIWDGASNAQAVRVSRTFAIDLLLMRRMHPRVRAKLAEIAASDPDSRLRERAASVL